MSRTLDVYLHDKLAGKLIQNDEGKLIFQYDEKYLHDPTAAQISICLPLRAEPYKEKVVRAFFSGLLPDEDARNRLARCLGVSAKNPFKLLEAIGGECAGALALYPAGMQPPAPQATDIELLDDKKLGEILELLKRRPLMVGADNIRLSLAGAQDKLAVSMVDNKVALVHGTSPTSHILKPLIDGINDSVQNEFFCLRLAANMKIKVPKTAIRWLGETPYFLIERYDRIIDADKTIKRLHQEDFCQALGIVPEFKYENEGGPNVAKCLELLKQNSFNPAADRLNFIQRLIFNYLIGNADAHGKNYSLLYTNVDPILSPAYDLLCTEVYPHVSTKMAMKIGGKYEPYSVFARHWHKLVPETAAARNDLNKELINMSEDCLEQAKMLKETLKSEGISSGIFDSIITVINKRAEFIKRSLS